MFSIGALDVHRHGLLFLIGFTVGFFIIRNMWKREEVNPLWLDRLMLFTFIGLIVGARLGHCLFYDPVYYLTHPLKVLYAREGGLAGHGALLGMVAAAFLFSKKVSCGNFLWTFDKLMTVTGPGAALMRFGNLLNHEIYGRPTDLPWGFRFISNLHAWKGGAEPVFTVPVHPTQLYEACCYLLTFALCLWLYFRKDAWKKEGLISGVFLICCFTSRFLIEFLKNPQATFEEGMFLNMGQLLSIPFILTGIYLVKKVIRDSDH